MWLVLLREEILMQIIMKRDVEDLGLEGDNVEVAKGYARNYLIPKGIALEASSQNIKTLGLQRKKIEVRRLNARKEAEQIKEKMEAMVISISRKAGAEGKLYGSVTTMDIATHLEKQDIVIDRRKLVLEKPIKAHGEFEVKVRIYPEVTASIKVVVVPDKEKEE